MFIMNMNDEKD